MNKDELNDISSAFFPVESIKRKISKACLVLFVSCFVLLSACSSPPGGYRDNWRSGIAVIGVTAKSGLSTAFNRNRLSADFASMLAETGKFQVLPAAGVRQLIGADAYSELMKRYANDGKISSVDLERLRAAKIPTPRVVLVRLENDKVTKKQPLTEVSRAQNGAVLIDRQRTTYSVKRLSRVSATLVDLRSARAIWRQDYKFEPETHNVYNEYLGSSFSGSVAAAVTNTLVNGAGKGEYPTPPNFTSTFHSLLRAVASDLPNR